MLFFLAARPAYHSSILLARGIAAPVAFACLAVLLDLDLDPLILTDEERAQACEKLHSLLQQGNDA